MSSGPAASWFLETSGMPCRTLLGLYTLLGAGGKSVESRQAVATGRSGSVGDTRLCGSWGHPLPPPGALALTSGEMAEVTPSYMLPLLPCSFRLPRDLVRPGLSPCPAPC